MITISKNPDVLKAIIEGVEAGIASICASVRSKAVRLAPVDTAHLRNSISWKTSLSGEGDWSGMPDPKTMEGYVGSPVEYAVYQEFGTRRLRPQPYLRPAIAIKALGQKGADVMKKMQEETARCELTIGNISSRETFGAGK